MSVAISSNTQEEYEDDFEKDLDWLISEESKSEEQDHDDEDIEACIDRALTEDEEGTKDERQSQSHCADDGEEERWPTPLDPLEGALVPDDDPSLVEDEEEVDEEKRSYLQKIEQANRQLQDQEPPNETRQRRLQFKDKLVDLVVPAPDYRKPRSPDPDGAPSRDSEVDGEVSGQLVKLKISPREENEGDGEDSQKECAREGRVLVEKDGKFDLVSLKEVESQSLLPPLPNGYHSEGRRGSPRQMELRESPSSSAKLHSNPAPSAETEPRHVPRPPDRPRVRPNSASHMQRAALGRQGVKRRVQSASGVPSHATFTLSPQQKELLSKLQQKRERLAREEEERRREEEEQKRQENELAFRTWLMRKRQQLQEERRVQRAQEMERMSCKPNYSDPDVAFKRWLQKKQEQQLKDRQLEDMRRVELQNTIYLHRPEECEKAFQKWLRRKQAEKRAEQQASRERSRRLVLEERRARRMQDLFCTVNDIRSLHFNDPYGYRF